MMKNIVKALCSGIIGLFLATGCNNGTDSSPEGESQILKNIPPKEASALIQQHNGNENFVILDVRTPAEFAGGYLENAVNINYRAKTFQGELDKLDKAHTYLIYCRSGNRSGRALQVMKNLQFNEVYNMTGGISRWIKEGLPTVKKEAANR